MLVRPIRRQAKKVPSAEKRANVWTEEFSAKQSFPKSRNHAW